MHFRNLRTIFCFLKIALIVLFVINRTTLNKAIAQEQKLREPTFLTPMLDQKMQITASNVSLAGILLTLTKMSGISFVADGEPSTDIREFKFGGTLREALDKICEDFDYSWKSTKSGLILMNKRFFRGDTLPQVHYAEMMRMSRDIVNALNAISHDTHAEELRLKGLMNPQWPEMLDALASSLTPDQASTLKHGGQLPMTELTPSQHTQIENIILSSALYSTRNQWAGLLDILTGLPKGYVRVELYQQPQFFVFALVDRDKALFPSSLTIMTRPIMTITNNSPK